MTAFWDFLFGGRTSCASANRPQGAYRLDNISSHAVAEGSRNDTVANDRINVQQVSVPDRPSLCEVA